MNKPNSAALPLLHTLERDQLIKMVEELQEEKLMRDAFAHISDTGTSDAALMWQGRNRFLAEMVRPVTLEPLLEQSYPVKEGGENKIIDGDNLAVMRSLLTDYRGGPKSGFDVIYMDPPYNTGEDTFIYNDRFRFSKAELDKIKKSVGRVEKMVGGDDPLKHTKWINHIAPRLWAARKLLKQSGVLIISIDEHEMPRLWLLLEEMYGERNRMATLIWERSRKNDAKYISEGHEYLFIWARDKAALDEVAKRKGKWRKRKDGVDAVLAAYAEAKAEYGEDNIEKIQEAVTSFFKELPKEHPAKKIRQKKVDARGVHRVDGDLSKPDGNGVRYAVIHPGTKQPCAIPSRGWVYPNPEDMQKLINEKRIYFGEDHTKIPSLKTYLHELETEVAMSIISKNSQASVQLVNRLFSEKAINNPKDHEMLAELFNLVTWNDPNAKIFDPYAGSGTTGHAVLEMNAVDGGNRTFVLVENGDPSNKKINRDAYTNGLTAERIRRVLSGNWADGKEHPALQGGFTFYRAKKEISRKSIMAATRESLADIILQIVEEDSNRIDCRIDNYTFLIGKTRLGYGIALVWQTGKNGDNQPLTRAIRDQILQEAHQAGVTKPVYVYATANVAPHNDALYRFQQIPDSILARLSLLQHEDGEE